MVFDHVQVRVVAGEGEVLAVHHSADVEFRIVETAGAGFFPSVNPKLPKVEVYSAPQRAGAARML
eukprot:12565036-Alexandrium_andersonii.AAC.1